jgi:hypothetical protein
MAPISGRSVADDDVFVWRHRQQDMNLKAHTVSVVITRPDHGDPAGGDVMIVRFKPLKLALDGRVNRIGRLASLERYLKGDLHFSPFIPDQTAPGEGPIRRKQNGCGSGHCS